MTEPDRPDQIDDNYEPPPATEGRKFLGAVGVPDQIDDTDPDRPNAYWRDGALILRGSAFGGCMWEMAAAAQGYEQLPPPDKLQVAFDEGHAREQEAIDVLKERGHQIRFQQRAGQLKVSDDVEIRFNADGYANPEPHQEIYPYPYIVEVKWLSEENFRRAKRGSVADVVPEYAWQLSVMMWAWGGDVPLPALWAYGNKATGEVEEEWVTTAPISRDDIFWRADQILDVARGEDVVTSGRPCDTPSQYPCYFHHLRPDPKKEPVSDVEPTVTLNYLLDAYMNARGTVDEMGKRKDRVRDEIVGELKEQGVTSGKVQVGQYEVTLSPGNMTIDWGEVPEELKSAKKQLDEVLAIYKTKPGTPYIRDVKKQGEQ